ncbi:MAG: ADP-ribosylglycohydrolase family protein [Gammaproteobacteria bacterium]|nr:ADP-ribosylglycohydrolase family protein [Gammaproteobacteria bacterium]
MTGLFREPERRPGDSGWLSRAQGCLLGQFCGDALGSQIEFLDAAQIREQYPDGIREMQDGGTFDTLAGQLTDDSEMALMLARSLVEQDRFDPQAVERAYRSWFKSEPFDCGNTIGSALAGRRDDGSESNGALMRVSPLGIFGVRQLPTQVAEWVRQDAGITHTNRVRQEANELYCVALSRAIMTGEEARLLYCHMLGWAEAGCSEPLVETVRRARREAWDEKAVHTGWVLVALQNALWQILHASSFEEAIVGTIRTAGIRTPTQPSAGHSMVPSAGSMEFPNAGSGPFWTVVRKRAVRTS